VEQFREVFHQQRLHGPQLLGNTGDRVEHALFAATPASASLALIGVKEVTWHVIITPRGKRQIRAHFALADQGYNLAVTDPLWEQQLTQLAPGNTSTTPKVMMCVSLSEPFEGFCYKLIAAVIRWPRLTSGPHQFRA
jgi:hypothetical protein